MGEVPIAIFFGLAISGIHFDLGMSTHQTFDQSHFHSISL
jgi:hypothetical protein